MGSKNSNQEGTSNSQLGALTTMFSRDNYGPKNQFISYHRRYPDGKYVPVMLSPGFRFCPQDDELIVDFLNKEINKDRPEYVRLLNINVYNHSPEDLAGTYQNMGNDEWYFFSPRERKYANGIRPNRAAGNGYWKATGADKKICRYGVEIGSKRCLVFYVGKPPGGNKTDWIMHEYVSKQPRRERTSTADMRLDDCVLCRIYKKPEHSPRKVNGTADSEPGESSRSAGRKRRQNQQQQRQNQQQATQHSLQGWSSSNQQQMMQYTNDIQTQEAGDYNPAGGQLHRLDDMDVAQPSFSSPQYNDFQAEPFHHLDDLDMAHPSFSSPQYYNDFQAEDAIGQLHHRLEINPDDAQRMMDMTHPSFASPLQYSDIHAAGGYNIPDGDQLHYPLPQSPLQNQYGTLPAGDYDLGRQFDNLGQQFDRLLESNPVEAQPITVWPNLPMQGTDITTAYLQEAGSSHDLGGEFDFLQEIIPQYPNLFHYHDLGNRSHATFDHLIRDNTVGMNQSYPHETLIQNGFGFNDQFHQSSSTLIPPSLDANYDLPQNGEAMHRDN